MRNRKWILVIVAVVTRGFVGHAHAAPTPREFGRRGTVELEGAGSFATSTDTQDGSPDVASTQISAAAKPGVFVWDDLQVFGKGSILWSSKHEENADTLTLSASSVGGGLRYHITPASRSVFPYAEASPEFLTGIMQVGGSEADVRGRRFEAGGGLAFRLGQDGLARLGVSFFDQATDVESQSDSHGAGSRGLQVVLGLSFLIEPDPPRGRDPALAGQRGARVRLTPTEIAISDKVFFEFGQAVVSPVSLPLLDEVASLLLANPQVQLIEVAGHTDDVGTAADNLQLSQARAEAVAIYLGSKGVAYARMRPRGYGETQPRVSVAGWADDPRLAAKLEQARGQNRRVEFRILPPPPTPPPATSPQP